MNAWMDLGLLNGISVKIILELSPEKGGLTLDVLAQRCLVRDLNTLRKDCLHLEQYWGMLTSRGGAHGQQTWMLVGKLDLHEGQLFWTPQKGENHRIASVPLDSEVEKTTSCADGTVQNVEKPRSGCMLPDSAVEKTTSCAAETVQNVEKHRTGCIPLDSEVEKTTSCAAETVQNVEKPRSAGSLIKADPVKIESLKKESLKQDLKKNLVFLDSRERENRALLKNASLLFGKPVNWHTAFSEKPPEELLAWLAQAWQAHQSGRSDRPWGLVYRGLLGELRQKQPDKHYQASPCEHLPDDYLEACDLASYACRDCRLEFNRRADLEAHLDERHLQPEFEPPRQTEPEAQAPAMLQNSRIVNAWQAVLRQLKMVMSCSFFETWVCDTLPVGWDESTGLLSVAASSLEAVEWLENRLASSARRMLCGILNREVDVRFVIS